MLHRDEKKVSFWLFLTNFEKFWQILTNFDKFWQNFWQILTNFDKFWQIFRQKSSIKTLNLPDRSKKHSRNTPVHTVYTISCRIGVNNMFDVVWPCTPRVHRGCTPRKSEDFTKKHTFLTIFFRMHQAVSSKFFWKFASKFFHFYIGRDGEKTCRKIAKKFFRRHDFLILWCHWD